MEKRKLTLIVVAFVVLIFLAFIISFSINDNPPKEPTELDNTDNLGGENQNEVIDEVGQEGEEPIDSDEEVTIEPDEEINEDLAKGEIEQVTITDPTLNEIYRKGKDLLYSFKLEEATDYFGNEIVNNGFFEHEEYSKVESFNNDLAYLAQIPFLIEYEDRGAIERVFKALDDPINTLILGIYLPHHLKLGLFGSPFGLMASITENSRISNIRVFDLEKIEGYNSKEVLDFLEVYSPNSTDKRLITFNLDGYDLYAYLYKDNEGVWHIYEIQGEANDNYITFKDYYDILEGVE